MHYETILQVGNPKLREVSLAVPDNEFQTEALSNLSSRLIHSMRHHQGIGLAAPQVGISKRIFVIGMEKNTKRPKELPIPLTVLINPSLTPMSDQKNSDYEACLSVGTTLMAQVPRYNKIYFSGFDIEGRLVEGEVSDLHARVIQHEFDHLDGIIFLDRVENPLSFGFYDELKKSNLC